MADLRKFPASTGRDAGYELDKVQNGRDPHDWKPMTTIGPGAREIRIQDADGAYRVIYVAKLVDAIHVPHCFQKKTRQTSDKDIQLARKRFKELLKERT